MSRPRPTPLVFVLLIAIPACDTDGPKAGVREPCSVGAGPLSECAPTEIDSAEDACWRMVECGALAVARPNQDEDCEFCDWASCVRFIEAMGDTQFQVALACVESAPCDQLKGPGAPEDPDPPPCLEQGRP